MAFHSFNLGWPTRSFVTFLGRVLYVRFLHSSSYFLAKSFSVASIDRKRNIHVSMGFEPSWSVTTCTHVPIVVCAGLLVSEAVTPITIMQLINTDIYFLLFGYPYIPTFALAWSVHQGCYWWRRFGCTSCTTFFKWRTSWRRTCNLYMHRRLLSSSLWALNCSIFWNALSILRVRTYTNLTFTPVALALILFINLLPRT